MIPGFPQSPGVRQRNEVFEFAKAWIGTALAFALLYSGGLASGFDALTSSDFAINFALAALTAGIGVVLHELAHRVVARYYGATAHFVANDQMLIISIALAAFTSFLFLAPGAVWHNGATSKRQSGMIAAAGPIVNIVFAAFFLGLLMLALNAQDAIFGSLGNSNALLLLDGLLMGFRVNALLGVFNMLPFGPIDGAKVLNWSAPVFGVLIGLAALLAFVLPRLLDIPPVF